jgi:hypothetical protein
VGGGHPWAIDPLPVHVGLAYATRGRTLFEVGTFNGLLPAEFQGLICSGAEGIGALIACVGHDGGTTLKYLLGIASLDPGCRTRCAQATGLFGAKRDRTVTLGSQAFH